MSATGTTAESDTATPHETIAQRWVEGFAEGWRAPESPDAFAAHFRELLASEVRLIQPQWPTVTGHRAFEEKFAKPLFALIPDLHGDVERWAARDDTIYIELTLRGTLSGRPLSWRVCDRISLRDGVGRRARVLLRSGPAHQGGRDDAPSLAAVPSPAGEKSRQPPHNKERTMNEVRLPQGTIRYRELGTGAPIVLVHGLLANGELWRDVAPRLAADFRVIVPDWPLGSHTIALNPDTDLSPLGLARIIADFLAALQLEGITLVGNDTGGAICQLVAVHHPERLGRLVLTPCDAYENFLPPAFRPLQALARIPGAIAMIAQLLRPRAARRLPLAYGWLAKTKIDDELSDAWLAPALSNRDVRREIAAILTGISKRFTLEAAERFGEFTKPVLIAWAPEDRFFKLRYGERLAAAFPNARLELIEDSYTFVPIDQPERTANLIAAFAREPALAH